MELSTPCYIPIKEKVFNALEKTQSENATKILLELSEQAGECLSSPSGASTPQNDAFDPEAAVRENAVELKKALLRDLKTYFERKAATKKRKRKQIDPVAALYKSLKPEKSKKADNGGIPVFRPSLAQFQDFKRLVHAIEPYGREAGLVKIIPPPEWADSQPHDMLDRLKVTRIRRPITQMFRGSQGVFKQCNVESSKVYTVPMWQKLCESFEEAALRSSHRHSFSHLDFTFEESSVYRSSLRAPPAAQKPTETLNVPPKEAVSAKTLQQAKEIESADWRKITGNRVCFTSEFCDEIERFFWRNISYYVPTYGADLKGTLFGFEWNDPWNLSKLDNVLKDLLVRPIPGVNSPYLYFGMFLATFAWHLEDMDLFSINYIHFGSPKQWYVIPPAHHKRFETLCKGLFGSEALKCPEFLRHKACLVSPKVLASHNIPVKKIIHRPGEIMITFPYGYHAGYNLGFNCAESLNFALDSWLPIAAKAGHCTCVGDSVHIDVSSLLQKPLKAAAQLKKAKVAAPKRCQLCGTLETDTERFLVALPLEKACFVHRFCAECITETAVVDDQVTGLDSVPNARWRLRCFLCKNDKPPPAPHDKKRACMQCCKGKCARAFHPLCAKKANLKRSTGPDGKPQFVCPTCDPETVKVAQAEKDLKHLALVRAAALQTEKVSVRWPDGKVYIGVLRGLDELSHECAVTFDDDTVYSVSYKSIILK